MKVKILIAGIYSDFERTPGKAGAQGLGEGALVDFPEWYAESLIEGGRAEKIDAGGTVVFEQATTDKPLVEQVEQTIDLNITSAAKELADKHGLDLTGIEGSGVGGRIITSDVQKLIED